jgi:hypothetical protein
MLTRIKVAASSVLAGVLLTCGTAVAQPGTPDPPPPTGVSDGQTYTVTQTSTDGVNREGNGTWTLSYNTIAGGNAAVADTFNRASHNAAQEQLLAAQVDPISDGTWTFDTNPRIYFGAASVSQLVSGMFNAVPSAHPTNFVSTVVIDSRSATPITLANLFIDQQAGLNRLSEQTKLILPAVAEQPPGAFDDDPGATPTDTNFANWIPTPAGIELHFNDYQFFHGTPVITVPWSALDGLLRPEMWALRLP